MRLVTAGVAASPAGGPRWRRQHELAVSDTERGLMCVSTWLAIGAMVAAAGSFLSLWRSRRGGGTTLKEDDPEAAPGNAGSLSPRS